MPLEVAVGTYFAQILMLSWASAAVFKVFWGAGLVGCVAGSIWPSVVD